MSDFPLREMYKKLAMQLVGKRLNDMPFGPALVLVRVKGGEIENCVVTPPSLVLPYMFTDSGPAEIEKLVNETLAVLGESHCMMLAHDAHIKIMEADLSPEVEEALTHRTLQNDAKAKRVIVFNVYHGTGTLNGFLPLSEDLVVEYAAPVEDMTVHRVKVGATDTTH